MTTKQIGNPGQAWSAGATWQNSTDNQMTQEVVHVLNATGQILYKGDIVCIDVTGTSAILGAGAATPTERRLLGVVGGEIGSNVTGGVAVGGFVPQQLAPTRTDTATVTNGSAAVTDASVLAADAGRSLTSPLGRFPAGTTILTDGLVVGVSFVASALATGNDTQATIADNTASIGPGWPSTTQFPMGAEVPVIMRGHGRINVAGAAVAALDLLGLGNVALTGGAQNNTGGITVAAVAGTVGTIIAVAQEAQAARDLSLTNIGIGGHETIRALIGHM